METARQTAQRVVDRLLDGETAEPTEPKNSERIESERPQFERPLRQEAKSMGVKKAWKKGKSMSGHQVAGKPGKVGYREALMRQALANIEEKKMGSGMKGMGKKKAPTVAKMPGHVGYGKR